MKQVKVKYFAIFREAVGQESETLDTSAETVAELFSERARQHSGLQHYDAALVAINDEVATWDSGFSNGDEILFFPPVAGG